ncbi:tail fiber assembly protein [Arsenophonus nasoniae]|uniref:Tail fiber assembly protein n=1 Tax=Arsenophonus nasoniae TaxID=638 RepID=A0AA95GS76_9GAMM|nr:tail fiber assembly protein [Arsenophonus nasoniae]WGM03913.1 tail fiber assembly protein [Arsenophonus nasoniae]
MEYSLEITNKDVITKDSIITTIGDDGFAKETGWIQVYHHYYDTTREYLHTSYTYVVKDTGIPAGSTLEAPIIPADDKAIIRSDDDKKWEYPDDYRGKPMFNTETQAVSIVDYIGEIKDGFTLLEPKTPFDQWDGEKWVTDKKAAHIAEDNSKKATLIDEAENVIRLLERKVKLGLASDEDKSNLHEWEVYSVKLNDIDTTTAPNIDWPKKPKN